MTAPVMPVLVFDVDGVLVDVGESYRETIARTVEHFTGVKPTREQIQGYKNQGGWNNDWALSQKIANDFGSPVSYDDTVQVFQRLFLGPNGNGAGGLIEREVWAPWPRTLERLAERFELAIFTGRLRSELEMTLRRCAPDLRFAPIVCTDDVKSGKPAPDGLLDIAGKRPGAGLWYVGDTVDDARSARAAGVRFVGIAAADNARRDELVELFRREGAEAILTSVNELEEALPR